MLTTTELETLATVLMTTTASTPGEAPKAPSRSPFLLALTVLVAVAGAWGLA